ncbi:MAG TPA: nucleotidyltransferase family protein, partial [Vicinamibacterales bacterium]
PPENSGSLVSYQNHYQKTDGYGVTHAFDVHWKISNLQSLAERLLVAELWDRRVSIPALGPGAFTVDTASALLLALVHRAGHHPGSKNLLWLYDLHVLAGGLSSGEQDHVVDVALDRGLARIAADGLSLARDRFGGVALDGLISTLQAMRWRDDHVPAIEERLTQAAVLRLDLEALPNWRTRGRLIREHLLPPARYMRARYGVQSNALVPGLYLWRVLHGMPKWLRRRKEG